MVFDTLDAWITARRLRAAVERDLNLVLRACLPDDWQPAHAEPRLTVGCIHPMENLIITMGGRSIVCNACFHRLDRYEVEYRLQSS